MYDTEDTHEWNKGLDVSKKEKAKREGSMGRYKKINRLAETNLEKTQLQNKAIMAVTSAAEQGRWRNKRRDGEIMECDRESEESAGVWEDSNKGKKKGLCG